MANNNDDSLPDLDHFGNDNSYQSIDEIIAEDQKEKEADKKNRKKEKNSSRLKIIGLSMSAVALIGLLGVGIATWNPLSNNNEKNGNDDKNMVSISATPNDDSSSSNKNKDGSIDDEDQDFYMEDGKYYPTKVPEWSKKEYNDSGRNLSDYKNDVINSFNTLEFYNAANTLPSESSGYTSDKSKQTLDDGSLNPYYSFWTSEVFDSEVGSYLERLLNPTFGGWQLYQYPAYPGNKDFDLSLVSDMFTSKWMNDNANKQMSDYVPVYADWNGDNYGGNNNLLDSGPRWYGEVESTETKFTYDDSTQNYNVHMVAHVKFTAWSKDQSKLEKNGTLTLDLVPNANNENTSTKNRVLISNATLKVDG